MRGEAGGEAGRKAGLAQGGQRLNQPMKDYGAVRLNPLLGESQRTTGQSSEGRVGSQPTAGCAKPTAMLP